MKVTLTFEVPDDFKKGMCRECPIHNMQEDNYGYKEISCPLNYKGSTYFETDAWIYGSDKCPLEIQGTCNTCKNIATLACEDCSAGKTNYYEKSVRTIDLIKKNNQ